MVWTPGIGTVEVAAVATNAIVRTGGIMMLFGAGVASSALLATGGWLNVQKGCSAVDTKVSSGAVLVASSGGIVTGALTIVSGATVRMDAGSILNFDISEKRAGGSNLGVDSEDSFGAAALFDFDSSTKTTGALLAAV